MLKTLSKIFQHIEQIYDEKRKSFGDLLKRLQEPRRFIQSLIGPRQVGKTTLSRQVMDDLGKPSRYVTADLAFLQDTASGIDLSVLILGSSPWLMQKRLTESLAGRFEIIPITHWSFKEMHEIFGWSLER